MNAERSSGASRETKMQVQSTTRRLHGTNVAIPPLMLLLSVPSLQALHNENVSLKAEIQNLQAQISDQVSERIIFKAYMRHIGLLFDTPFSPSLSLSLSLLASLLLHMLLIVPM